MAIDAGRFRHWVTIERPTAETFDSNGRRVAPGWEVFAERVQAAIEPLSARDAIVAEQTASKVIGRIVIRWRSGVDATMRIIHRGTIYNITGVLSDKMSGIEYMTLPVSAGINRG